MFQTLSLRRLNSLIKSLSCHISVWYHNQIPFNHGGRRGGFFSDMGRLKFSNLFLAIKYRRLFYVICKHAGFRYIFKGGGSDYFFQGYKEVEFPFNHEGWRLFPCHWPNFYPPTCNKWLLPKGQTIW